MSEVLEKRGGGQQPGEDPELWRRPRVARFYGVTPRTVSDWANRKIIPAPVINAPNCELWNSAHIRATAEGGK